MSAHDFDAQPRTNDVKIVENVTFEALLLPKFISDGLLLSGFRKPSPIQLSAIPLARIGLDLIVQARSGTGKTLVFAITALETINESNKRAQVIILAPTREIALQITDVITTIAKNGGLKSLKVATVIGGIHLDVDRKSIPNCQIIVGTPGRVRHLISDKLLDASAVRLFVLDEADKLFDLVFQTDINYIFNNIASDKQTIACSATFTPSLLEFTNAYMQNGKHVLPDNDPNPTLLGIKRLVYLTEYHVNHHTREQRKQDALLTILDRVRFNQCLIFSNYISRVIDLCTVLKNRGWVAAYFSSHQPQFERIRAICELKAHKARVLVTTDLAARGIDASNVNLIINMDTPANAATYLHRMGRAGRFGSLGLCISLVSKGAEQRHFQNLLYDVGGEETFVTVIPENFENVWTEEYKEIMYGIEGEPSSSSSSMSEETNDKDNSDAHSCDSSLSLSIASLPPEEMISDEWIPLEAESEHSRNESEYSIPIVSISNEWVNLLEIDQKPIETKMEINDKIPTETIMEISTSDDCNDLCFEIEPNLSHDSVPNNETNTCQNNVFVPNEMYWYSKINDSISEYVNQVRNLNKTY